MDNEHTRPPASNVPAAASHTPYLIAAVVVMAVLGIASIVAVAVLRPDKDNTPLYAAIAGMIAPTTISLLAFMRAGEGISVGQQAIVQGERTYHEVNSRMDQFRAELLKASEELVVKARAEGLKQGRQEGRVAADARTDMLSVATALSALPVTDGVVKVDIVSVPDHVAKKE